jgi:hypothetical protein
MRGKIVESIMLLWWPMISTSDAISIQSVEHAYIVKILLNI